MENLQSTLDKLTAQNDPRVSIFDIAIERLQTSNLTLSGRLLYESQLGTLAQHFSNWKLDTDSIRILYKKDLQRMHVATNLTGLYEEPTFGMALASELCYGTNLEVLDEQKNWVLTRQQDGYLGWAYRSYLADGLAASPTHIVLAPSLALHTEPEENSTIITRVLSGTGVIVQEKRGAWSCISANQSGWVPSKDLRALAEIPETTEPKRTLLIEDAQRMIGVPYLWGGTSGNGIDCSGFARLLHRWVGVDIPRDADMQFEAAKPVEPPFAAGDLFFFAEKDRQRKITHVGVSLGGWTMIHSSRRNNGVYIDDLQRHSSLRDIYVSAGSFLRVT